MYRGILSNEFNGFAMGFIKNSVQGERLDGTTPALALGLVGSRPGFMFFFFCWEQLSIAQLLKRLITCFGYTVGGSYVFYWVQIFTAQLLKAT